MHGPELAHSSKGFKSILLPTSPSPIRARLEVAIKTRSAKLHRVKNSLLLCLLILLQSCAMNSGQFVPLAQQSRLPDLQERDQFNRLISLRSYGAQDYLLVFFYPEADTPG